MPIYEYTCLDCGNSFSHLHKRLDEAVPPCPSCNSTNIRKRISSFSAKSAAAASCPRQDCCPGAQAHSCGCGCGCPHH